MLNSLKGNIEGSSIILKKKNGQDLKAGRLELVVTVLGPG